MKNMFFIVCIFLLSCTHTKSLTTDAQPSDINTILPECLATVIQEMSANPSEGTPISVTRYDYKGKRVYYVAAACCDKYNIVYDSACHILGFPDGGFTGRGDGKMIDFKKEAINAKVLWLPSPNK